MTEEALATGSEELSIAEASLEFGVSTSIIRAALRRQQLTSIPHRWGTRISRAAMIQFARTIAPMPRPTAMMTKPVPRPVYKPGPSREVKAEQRKQRIVEMLSKLEEATASHIHQLFMLHGQHIPYSTVVLTLHRLAAAGQLVNEKRAGRYIYHLSERGAEPTSQPLTPSSRSEAAPMPAKKPPTRTDASDVALTEVEEETLAVLRRIGEATTLAQIYQKMRPRPRYIEMVEAIRHLQKLRQVLRVKHKYCSLYRPA